MKKITVNNFDFSLLANSELETLVLAGATDFACKNAYGFEDFLIFGVEGVEQAEILPINSIALNTINTTIPSEFNHADQIHCTKYDQVQIYKAVAIAGVEPEDVDYVLLETKNIDIENIQTYFEDAIGNEDSRYKAKYLNSITLEVSEFQHTDYEDNHSYCTVSFYRNLYKDTTTNDYVLSRIIEGISDYIDTYAGLGHSLYIQECEEVLDTDISIKSYFPKSVPIKSVVSATIMDKGVEGDPLSSYVYVYDYYVKLDEVGNLCTRSQGLKLILKAGFFDIPPMDLQMLTAKLAHSEIAKTEGGSVKGTMKSEKIGRYKVEFDGAELLEVGFHSVLQLYKQNLTINAV